MNLREGLYRRNGKKVYIKQPEYNELKFVQELWGDKDTMKDIGGVFNFSENKWEMFYKKMVAPTDGKNFYCLTLRTASPAAPLYPVPRRCASLTAIASFITSTMKRAEGRRVRSAIEPRFFSSLAR